MVSTDAAASLSESRRRLDRALPGLQAAVPERMGTWIDERTGDVVLDVFIKGDPEEVAEAKSRIEDAADSLAQEIGLPARIVYLRSPVTTGHTYGGTDLSTCSGGFTVKETGTGVAGLLTAAHCDDSQTYFGFGSDGTYALTFKSEYRSGTTDAQWHTNAAHSVGPEFYADSTTYRRTVTSVTPRSSVTVGDPVCHRGKATGYSCGTVQSKNYQPLWPGHCPSTCDATWITVEGDYLRCYPGDSGGPVNFSYSAYGIYNGQVSSGPGTGECTFAIFMSVTYVPNLGVDIWVN
jgi:hypothetical protein